MKRIFPEQSSPTKRLDFMDIFTPTTAVRHNDRFCVRTGGREGQRRRRARSELNESFSGIVVNGSRSEATVRGRYLRSRNIAIILLRSAGSRFSTLSRFSGWLAASVSLFPFLFCGFCVSPSASDPLSSGLRVRLTTGQGDWLAPGSQRRDQQVI